MCSIPEAHCGAELGCVPGPVQRLELGGVSGCHPGESLCGFGGGPGRARCLQSEGQEPGSDGVTGSALRPGAGGSQLTCLSEVSTGGRV